MSARPDTWMPMYWGDYARDTGHLNNAAHGAYLMLIKHYWCTGTPLRDDDKELWRIACCDSLLEWKKLRPAIVRLFSKEGDSLHHKRIDKEIASASASVSAKAEAGKKGAERRWQKHGTPNGTPLADPSLSHGFANGKTHVEPMPTHNFANAPSPSEVLLSSSSSSTPRETPTRENGWNGWENGREVLAGFYLDEALPRIFGAAGIDPEPRHETVARAWMREGIEPDVIVRTIERVVARPNHTPGVMLSYFDRPVREARV